MCIINFVSCSLFFRMWTARPAAFEKQYKLYPFLQVTLWRGELLSFQCDPGRLRVCSRQLTVLPPKPPAQTLNTLTYLLQTRKRYHEMVHSWRHALIAILLVLLHFFLTSTLLHWVCCHQISTGVLLVTGIELARLQSLHISGTAS